MRLSAKQLGMLLLVLGAVATIAPALSSVWGVPVVGLAIFLSGIVELADAWHSGNTRTHYSSGSFSVLAGALISFQSAFAFSGLMVATSLVLLLDGVTNVARAVRGKGQGSPLWDLINGAGNILLALIVWALRDTIGVGRLRLLPWPSHGGFRVADIGRANATRGRSLRRARGTASQPRARLAAAPDYRLRSPRSDRGCPLAHADGLLLERDLRDGVLRDSRRPCGR